MDRGTVRTSALLVSTCKGMRLYRDLEKLPEAVRRKLASVAAGSEFATLVIADRRGMRELLEGRSKGIESACRPQVRGWRAAAGFLLAHWPETALSAALGLILWLVLVAR
jgi:hypothetical protein